MDIIVTTRNTEITPNFRDLVESKLEKVTVFYPRAQRVDVVLTRANNPRRADTAERIELTVYGKGPVIRAEARAADRYSAIDLAAAKLFERLRRFHDRRKNRRRARIDVPPGEDIFLAAEPAVEVEEVTEASEAQPEKLRSAKDMAPGQEREEQLGDSPVIVRQKVHEAQPMSVDEALAQMELVGHPFFLFIDEETEQPCAVYHRRGWTYGVIRLNTKVSNDD